ncbi:hypothetical protein N658DRAFT_513963 [Parathielavia hyrcaniae]|uniref:Uncharacterized protein n=1 Tax=Parathielavia hyrcaniae TaxID=113614 RepID=A0AAN6Q5H0_9PEZI|nr:hypothetical protein N658DRAFT_513963 [Parathielavia hyrcaniae]
MSLHAGIQGGVGWLESRDDDNSFNLSTNGIFQGDANRTSTQQMLINELKFSAVKSIRTSAIILASFNIIAAFATALGILCDSYFRRRRNDKKFKFWRNGFTFVPETEIYPLILSVGIFIQGFIFAGAQSTGLDSFFGSGCTWLAQLMFPAVFIVPYTQLVFGVETALRALERRPFPPRRKYNVPICLSITGMLLLSNFLISIFDRSPNSCLASLFWFVVHYSVICFGLFVAIATILSISTVVVFIRLHRSIQVEVTARVAASRMVYYLALAVISNSFVIPFFFVHAFMDGQGQNSNALNMSLIASVVSNLSGLMTGGLYLFLKSSTSSIVGPTDKVGEYENRRAQHKITRDDSDGADDDSPGFDSHIMNPVPGPRSLRRVDSEPSLIGTDKEEEPLAGTGIDAGSEKDGRRTPDSLRSHRLVSAVASVLMPKAPEPARIPSCFAGNHTRKRSYSLFPRSTVGSKPSMMLLPATTYSPANNLKPPLSMANFANMRHRRDSSMVSSATVQIGLRLSSVEDIPLPPQDRAATSDSVVHTLDCPNIPKKGKGLDTSSPNRAGAPGAGLVPLPLSVKVESETSQRDPVKEARMKMLPQVPKINSQVPKAEPAPGEATLSPGSYSPNTPTRVKLPSPRGVGFSMPAPKPASSPPRSPPRRRGTGDSTALPVNTKGDWI